MNIEKIPYSRPWRWFYSQNKVWLLAQTSDDERVGQYPTSDYDGTEPLLSFECSEEEVFEISEVMNRIVDCLNFCNSFPHDVNNESLYRDYRIESKYD